MKDPSYRDSYLGISLPPSSYLLRPPILRTPRHLHPGRGSLLQKTVGFEAQLDNGLGFRVQGLGFIVQGSGFRVWGLGPLQAPEARNSKP